ncbi:MAG: carbohydrate kinase family protein [Actinomycetales bacterium]
MITVIGEALIDIIVGPDGEVRTAAIGGAPLNTTRTLARLGTPAAFLGGVSTDVFGRRIQRKLVEDGVTMALAPVPEPTTLAIAELDDAGSATYRFVYEGTSATAVMPEAALAAVPQDCTAIHAGTLGLVFLPLAQATRAVVESARDDCLVMIDPNCRPAVMGATTAFQSTFDSVLQRADVVKVSRDDLTFLYPNTDPLEAARQLAARSGAAVLFTGGPSSVHVVTEHEQQTLPVPQVHVVDSVGAGDAFSGGFLAHWTQRGLSRADVTNFAALVAAAEFGIKVAAITCMRAGADPPFASELQVEG